jgi:hypothetical protein
MAIKDILRDVLQAVGEFNSRKLWKRFTNYDCFAVRIAGQEDLIIGGVLGDAGEEYGLSLFRGPRAVASFAGLLDSEALGDDVLEEVDLLGFNMDTFGNLPPDAQSLLREAGVHPRYDEQVPQFLVKPPGRQVRLPDESELRLLLVVLRAVIQADKKRLLQPARLEDEEGICILNISGGPAAPQMSVTRERLSRKDDSGPVRPALERFDLEGLSPLDATWLVGIPTLPGGIKGDDRVMQLLLVMDDASEYILQAHPILGGDLSEAAKILIETFRGGGRAGPKGLPREVLFSSRKLYDAMAPILEGAGVECVYEPVIPKLKAIVAELIGHMDADLGSFDEESQGEPQIPAPDDLKGWKGADLRLHRRFAEQFQSVKQLQSSRAVKRYFGKDDFAYYLQKHNERGVGPAYVAWAILDYRPTRTSKTHAEKMLEKGLPQAEAMLLRARMEAYPTLYRVAGHDAKAGTVDLEDVLLGGSVRVHDQLMSENIENNLFLAARAFVAGSFHFVEVAGPPLGARMGWEAVDYLQRCGMQFTPENLRRNAHAFGWLWDWMDEWQAAAKSTQLRNTDGEEFLWHTASFSVANPDQTRKTLMQREDIEYDEQADELVWNKPTGPDSRMMGDTVTLGRIEFVSDELIVTVNSVERFRAVRMWLEKLPGVVFRNVATRRWNEAEKDRPLDERISPPEPVEMTPELIAAVQERMNEHYMAWIDMQLPALGGKTPRQACRTQAGRQQVTMLIRTMPDPMGQAPVRIPREAMMRELGLAKEPVSLPSGDSQKPEAFQPSKPVLSEPKVARNAPCPCGSGRKYKKCCGR